MTNYSAATVELARIISSMDLEIDELKYKIKSLEKENEKLRGNAQLKTGLSNN